MLGLDVGGKSRGEIESALAAWSRRPVTIRAGGHSYHVPRGWLVSVDARATAARALGASSPVALVVPLHKQVAPVLARAGGAGDVLREIAEPSTRPSRPRWTLHGATVVVTPAQIGRELDRGALLDLLAGDASTIDAPFSAVQPPILDPAARSAGETARVLLDQPVALAFHGAGSGRSHRTSLRARCTSRRASTGTRSPSTRSPLARLVRPRVGRWTVHAHNAQFAVAGDTVHVVPARPGRDVDSARLAVTVTAAAHDGRTAEVELGPRDPDLTTADANALGIRRKLVSFTTQMGESSSNRIHNVHLMADFIDGTVIEPKHDFSFNDVVGERTAERGFLEGQEIIGSLVLPSIGGGVCQTATTLFNDAFELGLPILARTNHNLYLSHYPIGRDATVSWGGPDFVFRNDLKHGLLIKTSYTDSTLTFTFYGTNSIAVSSRAPARRRTGPGRR